MVEVDWICLNRKNASESEKRPFGSIAETHTCRTHRLCKASFFVFSLVTTVRFWSSWWMWGRHGKHGKQQSMAILWQFYGISVSEGARQLSSADCHSARKATAERCFVPLTYTTYRSCGTGLTWSKWGHVEPFAEYLMDWLIMDWPGLINSMNSWILMYEIDWNSF